VLSVVSAAIYVASAERRYTAHAQIVVNPLPADATDFLGIGGLIRDSAQAAPVVTAAQILDAPQVRHEASAVLGRDAGASFRVTPLGQSNVIDLAATSSSAKRAARAANVYATTALRLRETALQNELNAAISRLQARLAATGGGANNAVNAQITQRLAQLNSLVGSPDPTLALLGPAAPPTSASSPRTKMSLLVALACGLLLGSLVAILIDRFDRTLRHPADLRRGDGGEPVARVPYLASQDLHRYLTGSLPDAPRHRDAFRLVRSTVNGIAVHGQSPCVVAVCSIGRDEGRTATAVGLAKAYADTDRRVVVVDGDMRRSGATSSLAPGSAPSALPEVVRDGVFLSAALVAVAPNVWLLPAPDDPDGPDVIASGRLERVIGELRERFDVVVVDVPTFGDGPDGYALTGAADAAIVCARLDHTDRIALRDALERVRDFGVAAAVILVTDAEEVRGARDWVAEARRRASELNLRESLLNVRESLSVLRGRIRSIRRGRDAPTHELRPPGDLP
jgi:Mrp family chromosome partitioning ATPase